MKAVIRKIELPDEGRIIAISDVHANLPYLKGLLEKLRLRDEDTLVFCGDLLEKGAYSLETLRFVMELQKRRRVLAVQGNCDCWQNSIYRATGRSDVYTKRYLLSDSAGWGPGLLAQMCAEAGFEVREDTDMNEFRRVLTAAFKPEFDFLEELPHVILTDHYVFVHGGLPRGRPEDWDSWDCMKNDNFLGQGRSFTRWIIVGHWPVVLYGGDRACANPVIERERKIISIDGGCVLKDDGQLNALIIPRNGSEDFEIEHYDHFPVRTVKTAQKGSEKSTYVRWGDNIVCILERGEEFSRCMHVRTGYVLDILTKYLYGECGEVRCNDCTDYVLPLEPGDRVSVIEETSRGYLVKHNGVSGWYGGELL